MTPHRTHARHPNRLVVLLTGAAGGLGRTTAQVLVEDGFDVALVDRDADQLDRVAAELETRSRPGAAVPFVCDITDAEQVARTVDEVRHRIGGPDVLVHNAGVEPAFSFDGADMDVWDQTFEVNVRAAMLLLARCAPVWQEQGRGTFVAVGSRTWLSGSSTPAYVSSKAAIVGLARAVASHLGPSGVNANVVAPSFVHTPLNDGKWDDDYIRGYATRFVETTPLRRVIDPVDVAHAVSFLASARARNISGEVLHVAAGSQLAPTVR